MRPGYHSISRLFHACVVMLTGVCRQYPIECNTSKESIFVSRYARTLLGSLLGIRRLLKFALQLRREEGIWGLLRQQLTRWRPCQPADQLSLGMALQLLRRRLEAQAPLGAITHLFVGPAAPAGGAEQMTVFMCQGVNRLRPDALMLLVTNASSDDPPPWEGLPAPVVHLGLLRHVPAWAADDFSVRLLRELTLLVQPGCLHVINNVQAWEMVQAFGSELSQSIRLYGSVFARSYSVRDGFLPVFTRYAKPCLPWLSALFSDNQTVLDEVDVATGRERMYCLPSPCRIELSMLGHDHDNLLLKSAPRPRVLWAGRVCPEKNPEIFMALAALFPSCDFIMSGGHEDHYLCTVDAAANLTFTGQYLSPLEWLRQGRVDALVFTSFWEGLPNVLLEAGALGIPIIAGLVGGVGELLTAQTGYPLPAWSELDAYRTALEKLLAEPEEASRRALAMRELIGRRHTMSAFLEAVSKIDGYVGRSMS